MCKAAKEMLPQIYFGLERETKKKNCSCFPLPEGQSYERRSEPRPVASNSRTPMSRQKL